MDRLSRLMALASVALESDEGPLPKFLEFRLSAALGAIYHASPKTPIIVTVMLLVATLDGASGMLAADAAMVVTLLSGLVAVTGLFVVIQAMRRLLTILRDQRVLAEFAASFSHLGEATAPDPPQLLQIKRVILRHGPTGVSRDLLAA